MNEVNYNLVPTKYFSKKFQKLIKNNQKILDKILNTYSLLLFNPFDSRLGTHKVDAKISKDCYSTIVTGDLRIIWIFDGYEIKVIDLLDIGGHSGINSVYK